MAHEVAKQSPEVNRMADIVKQASCGEWLGVEIPKTKRTQSRKFAELFGLES